MMRWDHASVDSDRADGAPLTAGQAVGAAGSRIRHVLFDADGVIQSIPGGWHTAMEPYLGERAQEFPGFFAAAALRIAAEPASILFIDDSARNVEGARAAGLAAEQWELGQGHDALLALFGGHGVVRVRPADDGA
jgi:hypothetical protein